MCGICVCEVWSVFGMWSICVCDVWHVSMCMVYGISVVYDMCSIWYMCYDVFVVYGVCVIWCACLCMLSMMYL